MARYRYDVSDEDKRIALELALDTLGDMSGDERVDGPERDAIALVRHVGEELLDGTRD